MEKQTIYLDNNATTRPRPEVIEVVGKYSAQCFANPGSRHSVGRAARQVLEESREKIASILGADPDETVFTSGGTESTNLAVFGLTQSAPGTIALTAGEHPATMNACRRLRRSGWSLVSLPVDQTGLLTEFAGLPWDDIRFLSVILAHNETGVIQNIRLLADVCAQRSIPFHLDAVQAVGKIPVNFHELGVTTLALGAHKFHGPRGIGALLIRKGTRLAPTVFGGHQEAGRRPGTEPVALIAGMAKALELWESERAEQAGRIAALRDRLQTGLQKKCGPVVVNGNVQSRLPNTLNIAFPGTDAEATLVNLDLEGVACSLGSTCASGAAEPAPVLVAMKCPPEVYNSSLRFSLSYENTQDEVDEAVERIGTVVSRLRRVATA